MKIINKINYPENLPITQHRDEIVNAITRNPVVIVAGDTGSGKTTQLPKMCLEAGRGKKGIIGCTQPRRIAAISVAGRVAQELGEEGESLVGYKIRFQDRTRKTNRIRFMTDGILLAETQGDRSLRAYDTIIVDEAHERSLNIDFLIGLLQHLLLRRKDLKVLITSATIDTEKFAKCFGGAPVVEVSGRAYPIEVRYQPVEEEEEDDVSYVEQAINAVKDLRKNERAGDALVFMPTERDIMETVEGLNQVMKKEQKGWGKTVVLPLFGRLSAADQSRIFKPVKGNKVVVATNVAETSITVPGIRYVVDTGRARVSSYNVRARTMKLPIVRVSRAGCEQRKGRCGRVGPGVCVRLFSEDDYEGRPEFTQPEIQRSNLAEVILRMISLKLGNPVDFPFLDPPSKRAVNDGYALLQELDAVRPGRSPDSMRLTEIGRIMARLPLDPRISRMIIEARDKNALTEVAVIAAALSIQDPRVRPAEKEGQADAAHARFVDERSDFFSLLNIWKMHNNVSTKTRSRAKVRKFCRQNFLSYQRMREWHDIHEQIRSVFREEGGFSFNRKEAGYDAVHQAILSGSLRNIGLKKAKNIYQGGQGKEMVVFPGSGQYNRAGQWIMAAELVETSKLYARTVSSIKQEWIEPLARGLCRSSYSSPHWEKKRGQVVAVEKVTLFGLVIVAGRKVNFGRIRPDETREIFVQSALVEDELGGRYDFMDHNRRVIGELHEMENRTRRRDILVDDTLLYQFYDSRLDQGVCDRGRLNRMLKKRGGGNSLKMGREDILLELPDAGELAAFPREIEAGDFSFKVQYRFSPGSEDDGMSVFIPARLLPQVPETPFEWLAPGMLLEKIVFLLKGLPKNLRRHLIPVQQTAEELRHDFSPGSGSLLYALEQAIYHRFRIKVARKLWPLDKLPEHLKMRFCLVVKDKVIRSGRDLVKLSAGSVSLSDDDVVAQLKKKWEREHIISWDFDGLPEKIPVLGANARLTGFAYPAVEDEGRGGVSLRLSTDSVESRRKTRKGMVALYMQHFRNIRKTLKKDFALPTSSWALCEGFPSHAQLNKDILMYILATVFETGDGAIPSEETFSRRLATVKEDGLYVLGKKVLEQIVNALHERRETLDLIARSAAKAGRAAQTVNIFDTFRAHVQEILPLDFLDYYESDDLLEAPRYFKALKIRIERWVLSPAKDAEKAARLAPFEARLQGCLKEEALSPERQRLIKEYRQMLEEFKVSLFAQELKTRFPVSAKRLEKKWQELEGFG